MIITSTKYNPNRRLVYWLVRRASLPILCQISYLKLALVLRRPHQFRNNENTYYFKVLWLPIETKLTLFICFVAWLKSYNTNNMYGRNVYVPRNKLRSKFTFGQEPVICVIIPSNLRLFHMKYPWPLEKIKKHGAAYVQSADTLFSHYICGEASSPPDFSDRATHFPGSTNYPALD
uniref:Uncharacterized protein n=1 Tax=Glossina pallidipes TaxID=7398 RepID=A0A1B0A9L6_GLOPL